VQFRGELFVRSERQLQGLRAMTIVDPDGNKLRICTRLPHWRRSL
jgi:hypothetical protein